MDSKAQPIPSARDIRELLNERLPEPRRRLLDDVRRSAEAAGMPLFVVGGFVRDLLLGLPPGDFDFVVEGDATRLARRIARALGGQAVVHAPFRTAEWLAPGGLVIDFATARTETYARPAVLPAVAPASIVPDLIRRDFAANAIALRLDGESFGELLDPHNGRADLAARRLRVLHARSFQDDPTRLFRAVRYEQRLGFKISPGTRNLIPGAWGALAALTGDRLRNECQLIFREPRAAAMLARLTELDILGRVHPALRWEAGATTKAALIGALPFAEWRLEMPPEPDAFYWALLLEKTSPAEATEALVRVNASRAVAQAVSEAKTLQVGWARPSEAVAALERLSNLSIMAAYVLSGGEAAVLHEYLARWRFVRAEIGGDDLIALGLAPGPKFKHLLWKLRAARLDGEVSDVAGERALISAALGEAGGD